MAIRSAGPAGNSNTQGFNDPKSQAQIAAFKLREMPAARDYNRRNLERWNEHLRTQWELEHLGMTVTTAAREQCRREGRAVKPLYGRVT